jgi:serine/threonine protein phosphatase PrpC
MPSTTARWVSAAVSSPGTRAINEDLVCALPERGLFLVADGCGGAGKGDRACAILLGCLDEEGPDVEASLRRANNRIYQAIQADPSLKGMGATLALCVITGDRLDLYHLGEVRAYRIRAGRATLLTEDHTLAAQLVRTKQLTPEAALTHPGRKTILRYLGKEESLRLEHKVVELAPGDTLVMCTDGLYTGVPLASLAQLASEADPTAQEARLGELIEQALAAGSDDNLSGLVVRIHGDAPAAALSPVTAMRLAVERLVQAPRPEHELSLFLSDLAQLAAAAVEATAACLVCEGPGGRRMLASWPGPMSDDGWAAFEQGRSPTGWHLLPVPATGAPDGEQLLLGLQLPDGWQVRRERVAPYLDLAAWYFPLAMIGSRRMEA